MMRKPSRGRVSLLKGAQWVSVAAQPRFALPTGAYLSAYEPHRRRRSIEVSHDRRRRRSAVLSGPRRPSKKTSCLVGAFLPRPQGPTYGMLSSHRALTTTSRAIECMHSLCSSNAPADSFEIRPGHYLEPMICHGPRLRHEAHLIW